MRFLDAIKGRADSGQVRYSEILRASLGRTALPKCAGPMKLTVIAR